MSGRAKVTLASTRLCWGLGLLLPAILLVQGCVSQKGNSIIRLEAVYDVGREITDGEWREWGADPYCCTAYLRTDSLTLVGRGGGYLQSGPMRYSVLWFEVALPQGWAGSTDEREIPATAKGFIALRDGRSGFGIGYTVWPIESMEVLVSHTPEKVRITSVSPTIAPIYHIKFITERMSGEYPGKPNRYYGIREGYERGSSEYVEKPLEVGDMKLAIFIELDAPIDWRGEDSYIRALVETRHLVEPVLETGIINLPSPGYWGQK